jgi:hypothetical protein
MHTGDDVRRRIVLHIHRSALALGDSGVVIPACLLRKLLLLDDNQAQELDVTAREEIKSAIHVNDALARLRAVTGDVLLECSLLFLRCRRRLLCFRTL